MPEDLYVAACKWEQSALQSLWFYRSMLGPYEAYRVAMLRSEDEAIKLNASYLLRRVALTLCLNRTIAPQDWQIDAAEDERPLVRTAWQESISCSFSDCDEMTAIAVSCVSCALGVDVEDGKIERDGDPPEFWDVACRIFDKESLKFLQEHPPISRSPQLLQHWTRLEAFAKASGLGLAVMLKQPRISLLQDGRFYVAYAEQLWFGKTLRHDTCAISVCTDHPLHKMQVDYFEPMRVVEALANSSDR